MNTDTNMTGLTVDSISNGELYWWYECDGQRIAGCCFVREGRVESPYVDSLVVELRPSAIREIRQALQEWVDENT